MKILISALGSAGDVHPMVGLAVRLKQLGHEVAVLTNPYFGELVERVGLELIPLGTVEDFQASINNPNLWHPQKGIFIVMREGVLPSLPMIYSAIAERYVPGETIVVAHSLDFAARIAQEKLGVPVATVHLAPGVFRSVIRPPYLPPLYMPSWLPKPLKRMQFRMVDKVVDYLLAGGINQLRREVGLPRVRRVMDQWWYSPQRVIGLFPNWFGPPQADWPPQTRVVGFPLWDERGVTELPPDLEEFLSAGDPPVIFTPGSAMAHGHMFFHVAIEACQKLGRRAILLTRQTEQIPDDLPVGIRHYPFIPFSQVLPHAAALVHHGGIGTLAQGLSAGIPQLIMPMAFDQHDNARRLKELGVGLSIPRPQFRTPAVTAALQTLLTTEGISAQCRAMAERVRGADAIGKACELILELGGTDEAAQS